jgi:bifunctional non-homologous end joining protein LigD
MTKQSKRPSQALKTAMPASVKPMLCTLLKKPFNDPAYVYEVKWDGYRIIAYKDRKRIRLDSRGGLDYTKKYPPIVTALQELSHDIVLDGEAVVLNGEGKPDFDALQKFNGQNSGIIYYAFDILWMDGENLIQRPLLERKQILKKVIKGSNVIKYSEHFDDGLALYEQVVSLGLEGIVAKNRSSTYIPDDRSKLWYKIPTEKRQEFVIGGWVEPKHHDTSGHYCSVHTNVRSLNGLDMPVVDTKNATCLRY